MKNKKIEQHLKQALQQAPIGILDKIKSQPVARLERHDYITRQQPLVTSRRRWKPVVSLVSAAVIIIMFVIGGLLQSPIESSVVYLDVNPGIEIVTDQNDNVTSMRAVTDQGQGVVDSINYSGQNLYVVTEELLNEMMATGYIASSQRFLLLSVMHRDEEKGEAQTAKLSQGIHDCLEKHQIKPIVLKQSIAKSNTIADYADRYNVSIGKMTFIRNLIILNPEFEVEDLVTFSLQELVVISSLSRLDLSNIIDVEDDGLDEYYHRDSEQQPDGQNMDNNDGPADKSPRDDSEPEAEDPGESNDPKPEEESPQSDGDDKPWGNQLLDLEQAIDIALSLTNGGLVMEFELEEDDGRYIYELEIKKDGWEYEVGINAHTGRVLKYDKDDDDDKMPTGLIGHGRAIEIALGRTDGGTVIEFELDEDDGRYIYEFELKNDSREYEVEIDAHTGKVLYFERD